MFVAIFRLFFLVPDETGNFMGPPWDVNKIQFKVAQSVKPFLKKG